MYQITRKTNRNCEYQYSERKRAYACVKLCNRIRNSCEITISYFCSKFTNILSFDKIEHLFYFIYILTYTLIYLSILQIYSSYSSDARTEMGANPKAYISGYLEIIISVSPYLVVVIPRYNPLKSVTLSYYFLFTSNTLHI